MTTEKKKENTNPKQRNRILELSGVAAQMGATIFIGAYLGKYLDEKFPSNKKWFTIIFTLLSVGVALYAVVKQLDKINQKDD